MMKLILGSIFAWFAASLLTSCSGYHSGMQSDHFDGRRFFNPGKPMDKGFGTFLKWKFTSERKPWPKYSSLPVYDQPPERVDGDELRVSFVGHATVLIQTQGVNILTDPVWSERVSPVSWAGPSRVHPPGVAFDDLPPIDLILISHNHYDHLDLITLEKLWNVHKPRIIVPLGNDAIISAHTSAIKAEAYDWGESVAILPEIVVHTEPMHHWSARGLFDRNKALWAAYTIETPGGNIYFAGDTGYGNGDYFRAAREKFNTFRLAILPIGSYDPRWFMSYGHMNPEEALHAFHDLGQPYLQPIHHKAFQLADTGYEMPQNELQELIASMGKTKRRIIVLNNGEHRLIPN